MQGAAASMSTAAPSAVGYAAHFMARNHGP